MLVQPGPHIPHWRCRMLSMQSAFGQDGHSITGSERHCIYPRRLSMLTCSWATALASLRNRSSSAMAQKTETIPDPLSVLRKRGYDVFFLSRASEGIASRA